MKKILSFFLVASMILSLVACNTTGESAVSSSSPSSNSSLEGEQNAEGSNLPEEPSSETSTEGSVSDGGESSHVLVAYFSWADNAILADDVDAVASPSVIPPGNVQQLAGWVQEETGGDLFSIRVTDPYPSDWDDCLARANQERGDNARPELVENVGNLDQYDTVFLGYPNWNSDLPMPLYSFLKEYDFSGKTIIPFTTHGGSGFSGTIRTIAEMQPGATVIEDGLSLSRNSVPDAQRDVEEWVAGLGL